MVPIFIAVRPLRALILCDFILKRRQLFLEFLIGGFGKLFSHFHGHFHGLVVPLRSPNLIEKLVASRTVAIHIIMNRTFLVKILVILFRRVKLFSLDDGSHDFLVEAFTRFKVLFGLVSQSFLLFILNKYPGNVLCAAIHKLPAVIGRIDTSPKNFQQIFIGNLLWIIMDLNRLNMFGQAACHCFIGRVFPVTAGVARNNFLDSGQFLKRRLHAPKTSAGKGGRFCVHH